MYPTPIKQIATAIKQYPALENIIWVQEEPKNMGAYQHIYFKLNEMLAKENFTQLRMYYVGRPERSSPATGSVYRHKTEQADLVKKAFEI